MKYYNYNPGILDLNNYYKEIEKDNNIIGIFINLILNEDFELKVYLPSTNTMIDFNLFLDTFKNTSKKIIINILLGYKLINDKNSYDIANYNKVFVEKVIQTLGRYPNNFYLSSISTSTLYFLKLNPIPYKIGTIITRSDLGFIDVDFYIFSNYFINLEFIKSLIELNKMIMVFPNEKEDINLPLDIKNKIIYILESSVNI